MGKDTYTKDVNGKISDSASEGQIISAFMNKSNACIMFTTLKHKRNVIFSVNFPLLFVIVLSSPE